MIRVLALAVFSSIGTASYALTFDAVVTFEDGLTSPTQPGGILVGDYYADLGMTTSNLRFHNSAYPGNLPLDFEDDWGAVVDYGELGTTVGIIKFDRALDYVNLSGKAQSDFELIGTGLTPYSFSALAFNSDGILVDSESQMFGYSYTGPGDGSPYPLANLFLSLESDSDISAVHVFANRKFGLDSISFGGTLPPPPCNDRDVPPIGDGIPPKCTPPGAVPLPASLPFFLSAILGIGWLSHRRRV